MNFLRLYVFLQVVTNYCSLSAQNLVPNGSFENFRHCPGSYSLTPREFDVVGWRSISSGSPDHFHSCSEGEAAVPYNWAGVSDAFEGFGYTGIYMWMKTDKNYREYLHCKLSQPLMKDSLYRLEFHYKLSSYSKYAIDRVGVLLSDSLKTFAHDRTLGIQPTVSFIQDSALTLNTGTWETALAEFRATGNEQYLTIGNFSDNKQTKSYHISFRPESEPMLAQSAYYYIDDVSVTPVFQPVLPQATDVIAFAEDNPQLNTIYVLENIQFEFNSYALLPISFQDLDKVVNYLTGNPAIRLTLSGHTDEIGSAEYNLALSTRRAESAAAYLKAKGIEAQRIFTRGYGESKPLTESKSDVGKSQNRRVEISFHN